MVFQESKQECPCRGTGVIRVKKVAAAVICSCPVAKLIAKNAVIFTRIDREVVHG